MKFCNNIYFLLVSLSYIVGVYSLSSDLLPTTAVCGISGGDGSDRKGIVVTSLNEYPWLTLLEYTKPNGKGFYCGGSLINNRYVMTAAHCVKGVPSTWSLVSVRLGEYNQDTNPDCVKVNDEETCAPDVIDVTAAEIIVHEDYDSNTKANDIALVRLENSIDFTDYIKPICLPTSESLLSKNLTGINMVVAGWGRTPGNVQNKIKVKLSVPVQTNENCAKKFEGKSFVGAGHLCAGVGGDDMCNGAGGTVLVSEVEENGKSNWYAGGIMSYGVTPCGRDDFPSVYTRVSEYVPWIISKLKP